MQFTITSQVVSLAAIASTEFKSYAYIRFQLSPSGKHLEVSATNGKSLIILGFAVRPDDVVAKGEICGVSARDLKWVGKLGKTLQFSTLRGGKLQVMGGGFPGITGTVDNFHTSEYTPIRAVLPIKLAAKTSPLFNVDISILAPLCNIFTKFGFNNCAIRNGPKESSPTTIQAVAVNPSQGCAAYAMARVMPVYADNRNGQLWPTGEPDYMELTDEQKQYHELALYIDSMEKKSKSS